MLLNVDALSPSCFHEANVFVQGALLAQRNKSTGGRAGGRKRGLLPLPRPTLATGPPSLPTVKGEGQDSPHPMKKARTVEEEEEGGGGDEVEGQEEEEEEGKEKRRRSNSTRDESIFG